MDLYVRLENLERLQDVGGHSSLYIMEMGDFAKAKTKASSFILECLWLVPLLPLTKGRVVPCGNVMVQLLV